MMKIGCGKILVEGPKTAPTSASRIGETQSPALINPLPLIGGIRVHLRALFRALIRITVRVPDRFYNTGALAIRIGCWGM